MAEEDECDCRLHRVQAKNVPWCAMAACGKLAACLLASDRTTLARDARENDRIYYVLGVVALVLAAYVVVT